MNKYIGFKMVEAKPMTKERFDAYKAKSDIMDGRQETPGYKVVYVDGYTSWSPKEVFEKAYMQVSDNNTITQENVDNFIAYYEAYTMGDKTTVVKVTLKNGFIIVESSSCVDPANYNEQVGIDICINRIKNKIWELLGFLLQTAKNGII